MDEYNVDQLYKVTRNLEEEALEWRRYVGGLAEELERCEEEIVQLRWQVGKARVMDGTSGIGRDRDRGDKIGKF